MYRVWYWAMIDRENDGRFIASIPDLGELAAYGHSDKDAVAHVTELANQHVRASCRRRPTRSAAASLLRDAKPYPIERGRARDDSGGGRAPGSVANSALSHVRIKWPAMEQPSPRNQVQRLPIEARAGGAEVEIHWPTSMPPTCAPGRCQS